MTARSIVTNAPILTVSICEHHWRVCVCLTLTIVAALLA